MFEKIKKRDGSVVSFEPDRIANAISKAGKATSEFDKNTAQELAIKALDFAGKVIRNEVPSVEEVQDIVEQTLMNSPYYKTAKAYTIYRDQHSKLREIANNDKIELVDQYLDQLDWKVKENSNMSFSLQGLNNYISSEISKNYWLNKIYTPEIGDAHTNGDFHIHDLNILSVYCVGWDLQDLLLSGFQGAAGKVESNPPKHFRSALGQMVNFLFTLQGESAGAQAFSNVDTLLAPFIKYDNLSYKEVKQALQEFIFNLNVPTRIGFQTPFTNITLDLIVPGFLAKQSAIIGGEPVKETYGDFQEEVNLFNKALLEVLQEGDAKGRVFTFPIPTYNITKDFDWDNPNLEGLWEMTAKYGIPYFSNFVNSDMKPEDTRSMCCRLRIDNRELEKKGGGLFGANPLTGSIGVVTINMARLGHTSKNEDDFLKKLERLMNLAKNSLETKRKLLERLTDQDLYPYAKFYLRNIKQRHGNYWQNHFSTIGVSGMNEACLNMFKQDIGTEKSLAFTKKVLDFMRSTLEDFQKETGRNFNLEATPAESVSYRFAKVDKERYPVSVCANEAEYIKGAEPFYTNSTQLPTMYSDDVFEILDLQDDIQAKYTGGTVLHIFVGEKITSTESVKQLVRKICNNYSLPYFTITPTFSICPNHGYIAGEHALCPNCSAESEVYSRVVGYLRPVNQWNKGKQAEFKLRKTFKIDDYSKNCVEELKQLEQVM
ncbi:MAG TPA: ribonucleoside triphosphate reductase [Candidatus Gastranaerophilales bacterium]|nr:ribonucleoside triphosphate reductase [Candidatus Gastranaerophilales bacterium]